MRGIITLFCSSLDSLRQLFYFYLNYKVFALRRLSFFLHEILFLKWYKDSK